MKFIKKILVVMLIFIVVISGVFSGNHIVLGVGNTSIEDFITEMINAKVVKSGTHTETTDKGTTISTSGDFYVKMGNYEDTATWVTNFSNIDPSTITDEELIITDGGGKEYTKTSSEWLIWAAECIETSFWENWEVGDQTDTIYAMKDELKEIKKQANISEETKNEIDETITEIEDITEETEDITEEDEDARRGDVDDHYNDEDDSDIGGILLEPIVWFINLIADAAQSLVTAFMRDDIGFRAILQGKRFATISANIAKKMEITEDSTDSKHIIWYIDDDGNNSYSETDTILLDVQGSKEQPSDWKGDTTMSADGTQAYYRTDGLVSGSDVEDYDGSLGGNEYFINASGYKNRYSYPLIAYSPEEIFAGDVEILNANFLSNNESSNTAFTTIRNIIKTWFRALRYLGLAGLLSVLIYTGIKIMTSSVSQDKAKYKERIVDWVIAMVIMFLLPYIMSFIFMISDKLIDLFNDDNVQQPITVYVYDPNAGNGDWTTALSDSFLRRNV